MSTVPMFKMILRSETFDNFSAAFLMVKPELHKPDVRTPLTGNEIETNGRQFRIEQWKTYEMN